MAIERTLSIVKPDVVKENTVGKIVTHLEEGGLRIIAAKFIQLSKESADGFYIEHKTKHFFSSLVSFITSTPVLILVLEGDNAVERNRELMGATNPAEATEGTIRKLYAKSIEANSVHGSDSLASAEREISYFFDKNEIFSY